MSKPDAFESDILKLIFNATTIAGMARDDTSPVTNLSESSARGGIMRMCRS